MPELPEVETYVRDLEPELTARTIEQAEVFWPRTIATPDVPEFLHEIRGQRFEKFERRGKYMLLGLESGKTLIIHLRMTGELHVYPPDFAPDKHTHVRFFLDDGRHLHYRDQRKFGRIWLVDDVQTVIHRLGPEPLSADFSVDAFGAKLDGRKATIKALLLDQSVVAGVGNIYADEALFRAKIHPRRHGGSITVDEQLSLRDAIRVVLERGIALKGSSLQNYIRLDGMKGNFQDEHQVFRKTGQPCPECGHPIERIIVTQRSTHFCPNCQHQDK